MSNAKKNQSGSVIIKSGSAVIGQEVAEKIFGKTDFEVILPPGSPKFKMPDMDFDLTESEPARKAGEAEVVDALTEYYQFQEQLATSPSAGKVQGEPDEVPANLSHIRATLAWLKQIRPRQLRHREAADTIIEAMQSRSDLTRLLEGIKPRQLRERIERTMANVFARLESAVDDKSIARDDRVLKIIPAADPVSTTARWINADGSFASEDVWIHDLIAQAASDFGGFKAGRAATIADLTVGLLQKRQIGFGRLQPTSSISDRGGIVYELSDSKSSVKSMSIIPIPVSDPASPFSALPHVPKAGIWQSSYYSFSSVSALLSNTLPRTYQTLSNSSKSDRRNSVKRPTKKHINVK